MYSILNLCILLISVYVLQTSAQCQSYGVDFVDGGGPYFINTGSTDYFSFISYFEGCGVSEGTITPILIDPNGDEFFCSDIPTNPNDVDETSICDVAGNVVLKSQMFSGDWIVVLEGPDFAYMRTFAIAAGVQSTVTLTPTAIFNMTTTPVTTTTTTITSVYNTTLTAATTTVPSSTKVITKTTTPATVTTTSTLTLTRTIWRFTNAITWLTKTKTATCAKTQGPISDPTCTVTHTKMAATTSTSSKGRRRVLDRAATFRGRRAPGLANIERNIERRTPDAPTTTVIETTSTVNVTNTFVAPTSTEIDTTFAMVTSTITPVPATVLSGVSTTKTTVTAATPTRTIPTLTIMSTTSIITISATLFTTTKVTPTGVVCATTWS